ncbi:MAG: Prolyl endopeptidase [Acidobacteriaceae bacterium]|nr:Prolyl endopeptidase [Acidobacteriaceae bacterium]
MAGVPRLMLLSLAILSCAAVVFAGTDDSKSKDDSPAPGYPKAKVAVVEDTLHGTKIADPYRWLEDANNPETQQFTRDELAYTRSLLDKQPQRERINARLQQLLTIGSIGTPSNRGNLYFYSRREGTQNQPILYVRNGISGSDRVLIDPNTLSADGTVALDWWHPSDDGKYVAYGTSPGGSEISTLRIIETDTGKLLGENIDRTRAASIAWLPDNSGFYYTKLPRPGDVAAGQEMYNRHIFFHKLGANLDGLKDAHVFGEGHPPQEWPNVNISEDGNWLVIHETLGSSGRTDLYLLDLRKSDNTPQLVAGGKDFVYYGQVFKGDLYIQTNDGATRFHIFKVAASNPKRENWKEIIPQADSVVKNIGVIGGKLIAEYEKDASSRLKVFSLDGKHLSDIPLPSLGSVSGIGGEWYSKEALFRFDSFTVAPSIYRYDIASGKTTEWARINAPVDGSAYEMKQVFYPSKDGTKIPMFIVSKKGTKLDGKNPTMLTGYGGFNISRTPAFSGWLYLWLENGGVYADANLRGGSEYGEEWHRAGMLSKKQNVFDDFIAAAEYLIAQKYTDKDQLAVYGRSNGGLLTGAVLTQRPDLYRAVVCGVPLLDMIRYHQFQIARLWIPEYGSSEDPEQFKWLYAYSPYHNVKEKTLYPSILFFTSEGDTRVDPLHAKKMTALMQAAAANGPDRPILMRIEPKAGHGVGKPVSKQIQEWTDIYTYLFWQLGMK